MIERTFEDMGGMGGQTRYTRDLDRRMQRSINEAAIRPLPRSLTEDEIDLCHNRVIKPESPVPVRAWITYELATIP